MHVLCVQCCINRVTNYMYSHAWQQEAGIQLNRTLGNLFGKERKSGMERQAQSLLAGGVHYCVLSFTLFSNRVEHAVLHSTYSSSDGSHCTATWISSFGSFSCFCPLLINNCCLPWPFLSFCVQSYGPKALVKTCLYTMPPDRHFVVDTLKGYGHSNVIACIGAGHAFK